MKKNSPLQLLILVFLVFCQNGMGQKSSGEVAFTAIPRLHHQFPGNDIFKGGINQISSTANLIPSSLLTGIVSYWTLDETSGNAIDVAGGGNNGTPSGVTQHIAGKINTAYGFNGTSSYIDMGNKANLSLTTSGSISAWIYPTDVTHMGLIVSKGNPGSDLNGFNLGFLYNTLYWELDNSTARIQGSCPIAGNIVNNTWYLVTLTWNGSNVNLYLNALAVSAPVAQTVTPVSNVYPFRIGARGDNLGSNLFQGTIDEVGVWNRGLTATEVANLYNSGSGISWPFSTGNPVSMTTNSGTTPQNATVSTAFSNALAVTIKDAGGNPLSGVSVVFTAPATGASGTFSNTTNTITVSTNASGIASAPFTANATAGGPYNVTAASNGLTTVNIALTNLAGNPVSMTTNSVTTPQSATVSTAFSNAQAVTIKDAGGNPLSGVSVVFTAPATGASGTFSNTTNTITVSTNASGIASAPFTANATAGGPYNVSATSGTFTTVNFSLTNNVTGTSSIITGIISYWPLNETGPLATGSATDVAGGGNNGTPSGVMEGV